MDRRIKLASLSGIYAVFYAFCLYRNLGGATFPFFVIGTLFYIWLCTREFGLTWKKDTVSEAIAVICIGISHPLTANGIIHFFNILAVTALIFHIILHQFAEDDKWNFFQHIVNLIVTFGGGFSHFFAPLRDYFTYKKEKAEAVEEEKAPTFPFHIIILTAFACIPALIIVILLLGSADAVFRNMIKGLFNFPDINIFGVVFLIALVFFFSYAVFSKLLSSPFKAEEAQLHKGNSLIAITAGIMFDAIYFIFSVIQIFYLFMGKFSLPEGYTYAQYAREGFFELLFVCLINLCMVLFGIFFFEENKAVKIILSVLCGCTYIMTFSSAFRMILYIRYYYFSFLRIFVLWALAVIALLLTGLLLQIWKKKFPLFRYSLLVCAICYVVLAFAQPDYLVAKWNLANSESTGSEFFLSENSYSDYDYLVYQLSKDAAPVLMKNENTRDKYVESWYYENHKTGLRTFNLSDYRSRKLMEEYKN